MKFSAKLKELRLKKEKSKPNHLVGFGILVQVFITNLKREVKTIKKEEPQLRELRVEALDWCT